MVAAHKLSAIVSACLLLNACQFIGTMEERSLAPRDAGVEDGPAQDVEEAGDAADAGDVIGERCTLEDEKAPLPGQASVRLANLVPDDQEVDFCLRKVGEPWATAFMEGLGTQCPSIKYPDMIRPRPLDAGRWDIKVIAFGQGCEGSAVAEANNVDLVPNFVTTVVLMGGNGVPFRIVALPEVKLSKDSSLRFVNAVPDLDNALYFSILNRGRMPAKAMSNLSGPDGVAFGAVLPEQASTLIGPVNEAGYLDYQSTEFNVGASQKGGDDAVLAAVIPLSLRQTTLTAIGIPGSYDYPVRGLLCDEADVVSDMYTPCQVTELPLIAVDTMNIGLYGLAAKFEAERREAALDALANLTSDVLCVQEITRESDRASLIDRAKTANTFLHAYNPQFDLDTVPAESKNQQGELPPPPTVACESSEVQAQAQAFIDCLTTNCSTEPGSPDGILDVSKGGVGCISSKCVAQALVFLGPDYGKRSCFTCMFVNLSGEETMGTALSECTTNPKAGFVFRGASPQIMLSRYPLSNTESYVLPSTNWRRAVLRAVVEIPDTDPVDVFCLHLAPIQGPQFPYSGHYGGDMEVDGEVLTEWSAEQYYEAQLALAWIKQQATPGRLAVIAGEFRSSEENEDAGLSALNPATIRHFKKDAALTPAQPPDWQPLCNWCATPENAYGSASSFLTAHIFTMGSTVKVEGFERILADPNAVALPAQPFQGPVSDSFGWRSRIIYKLGW